MIRHVAAERGCALPGRLVTAHAVCRTQRVVAVDVARRARRRHGRHVRADESETRCAVIELPISPGRDRMAGRTSSGRRWESGCDVVWHIAAKRRRALPGRLMAAHTIG